MKRIIIILALIISTNPVFAQNPIVKWKDTISWLEKYYYYPEEESPNFDWPCSYYPRPLSDNTVQAIDGTRLPVLPGAYHLRLTGEEYCDYVPVTSVSFYLKYENSKEAKKLFDNIVQFFNKNFKKDITSLQYENGAYYPLVSILWDDTDNDQAGRSGKIELCMIDVQVPGVSDDGNLTIPDSKGSIQVSYGVKNVRNYYFFRTNLLPAGDKVALSDGTVIPLMPGKKVSKIDVGNTQLAGKFTGASISYEYRIWHKDEKTFYTSYYDEEYVKLYSFYANHFKVPVEKWEAFQEDDSTFVLSYKDTKFEIQIRVNGIAKDKGKHTDLKTFYDWLRTKRPDLLPLDESGFFIFIQYYGKHQIIPGSEEAPLPKYQKYAKGDFDMDSIVMVEANDWEYENALESTGADDEGYDTEYTDEEGLLDAWGADDGESYEDYGDY